MIARQYREIVDSITFLKYLVLDTIERIYCYICN